MRLPKPILLVAIILYIISGSSFVYFDHLKELSGIEGLSFGYGKLLNNLRLHHRYIVCDMSYMPRDLCFSAHRLPFIPYFLYYSSILFENNLFLITLFKNTLASLLLFKTLKYVYDRTNNKITYSILILFVITFPRWILHYFQINTEEGYIIPFFAFYVAFLFFKSESIYDFGLFILSVTGLLYSKNSLLLVAACAPFFYFIIYRQAAKTLVITIFVGLGITSQAFFNMKNTGKFTVASSWEGWNLFKGNNPYTLKYYPDHSLDELDYKGLTPGMDEVFRTEWEYSDFLKSTGMEYMIANPTKIIELSTLKAYLFFVTPVSYGCCAPSGILRWINNVYLTIFRIIFWSCLFWTAYLTFFQKKLSIENQRVSILYILILILFSGFYIIGFVYERHISPIFLVSIFYFTKVCSTNFENRMECVLIKIKHIATPKKQTEK